MVRYAHCDRYLPGLGRFFANFRSGATTFRLKVKGLTIFLDTWLERPSSMPTFLTVNDVEECDYIFISHAHFDQSVHVLHQSFRA